MISAVCPGCHRKLKVPEIRVGSAVACPACGVHFLANRPAEGDYAAAPPPVRAAAEPDQVEPDDGQAWEEQPAAEPAPYRPAIYQPAHESEPWYYVVFTLLTWLFLLLNVAGFLLAMGRLMAAGLPEAAALFLVLGGVWLSGIFWSCTGALVLIDAARNIRRRR